MRYIPNIDLRHGLRVVLLAQLAIAGLLIATDILEMLPSVFKKQVETPVGPVVPGDQRRQYRTDRPAPDLPVLEGPADLQMPEEFSDRLKFTEHTVESIGRVLLLSGGIELGDAQRFEAHLTGMDDRPDLIALHSPGGLVSEAQEIGRKVRSASLPTAVMPGAYCVSSCPYILAGGVDRIVSLRGMVGMHQHYYQKPQYLPVFFAVEDIQISQGETLEFLIEMGVDPSIMVFSLSTPPEQIYALVEDELRDTKIASKIVE
ncbi:MAG: hypothetical protein AAF709_22020 [Pseudomonadota bacterium]